MAFKIPSPFSSPFRAVMMVILLWPLVDPKHDISFIFGFGLAAAWFCNIYGFFTGGPVGHSGFLLDNSSENRSKRLQVLLLSVIAVIGGIYLAIFVEDSHQIHIWRDH